MRDQKNLFANIDWPLVGFYIGLILIGWINIYSAGLNQQHLYIFDTSQRYGMQMIWILTSFALAFMILLTDSKVFTTFAYPLYFIGTLVLIFVIFGGTEVGGSKTWLSLGGLRIQPAEFTKITTALALAKYLSVLNLNVEETHNKILPVLLIIIPAVIIR